MEDKFEELRDIELISFDEPEFSLELIEAWEDDDEEEVIEVVAEPVREIPTGEGLLRRQAREILIEEMNHIKQQRNVAAHKAWIKAVDEHYQVGGERPTEPTYTPVFSSKAINHAVQMARHIGGYEELLKNSGF